MATAVPHVDDHGTAEQPACVLVVDDHADTRRAYAEWLRMAGFRTAEADNGVLAIRTAREILPDAILLDHAMPMMDGLHAAMLLKRHAKTGCIPIVMITAFGDLVRDRHRCDVCLDKPCELSEIVDAIQAILGSTASGSKKPSG